MLQKTPQYRSKWKFTAEMTDVEETNLHVTTSASNYRPAKENFELNFANIQPTTVSL